MAPLNWFQRLWLAGTKRFVPRLSTVMDRAGGTLESLSERLEMYREIEAGRRHERSNLAAELREALRMAGPGQWLGGVEHENNAAVAIPVKESIADLELALEDRGWQRLWAMSQTEFSRWGIQQIILMCRLYRIKNPLIKRGITVSAYYVFGRGFEVSAEDEQANEVIQAFFNDARNARAIGQNALVQKEIGLFTDGNVFWSFFTDPLDGTCLVRTIDALEMQEIVTNPDDSSEPRFYRRMWSANIFDESTGTYTTKTKEEWYVDIDYEPPTQLREINGKPVARDASGSYVRILHQKDGGLEKWTFGCPRCYSAIDWARAYKERLEDYATIVRALSRFAIDIETKGGAPAIAVLKQELATTLANNTTQYESNPPAVTGSAWISGPGTKVKAFDGAGKTPPPEEGRRMAHMVYMDFGLPETFFSDVAVGTLATAKSLDRPTELLFKMRQEFWRETFRTMCRHVLSVSARAPRGKLREAARSTKDLAALKIKTDFPSILEGDLIEEVDSVVKAITLGQQGQSGIDLKTGIRLLLSKLGVDNIEVVLNAMFPEGTYDPDRTAEPEKTEQVPPPDTESREAAMLRACTSLLEAAQRLSA